MSRLIVASNRVALPGKASAGGLAVALKDALEQRGGLWCGWSGEVSDYPSIHHASNDKVDYATFDLTQQEYEDYYLGFSNSLVWPLFHYRTDLAHYRRAMFDAYENVNARFADCIAGRAEDGDIIWVHDYHLLTLGRHLRQRGLDKPSIGFFLHIPFPAPEIFHTLPVHEAVLKALCEYDLVGFQTEEHAKAFIACLQVADQTTTSTQQENRWHVSAFGRKLTVGAFPISIDTADMQSTAEDAEQEPKTKQLADSLNDQHLIIGVDRMDYSKGLPNRMQAFDHFLQTYPEHRRQTTYIQITPVSRTDVDEYQALGEEVETLAAHANGLHGDVDWTPIRFIEKGFPRESLAGFYRTARVGLVTPLRDGMNLVAKEYVACQNPADPGVLILSQFAGAAHELAAGALLVNPFDTEAMANALHQALTMSLSERKTRHQTMIQVLEDNTIFTWSNDFLKTLDATRQGGDVVYASFPS